MSAIGDLVRASVGEFVLPIEHWSPTSLAMFQRCPRQFQERYVLKKKQRPAEAPLTGSAVHAGIEKNFKQKIRSHVDLPLGEILEWYDDEGFSKQVSKEEEKAGEETDWDTSPEAARRRGHAMLREYHSLVVPRIQPLEAEQAISIDLGLGVPIVGRFDVERAESVIDVKTGKTTQRKPKEDWRFQALIYGEARNRPVEFHNVSARVTQDRITNVISVGKVTVTTPLEAEALLVHPSPPEREEMKRSIQALNAVANFHMKTYGPDEPWPTWGRFHSWACEYCGFIDNCPAWRTT